MDIWFTLGNSLIICGRSNSGKTTWVKKLIEHRDVLFKEKIQKIYWFYSTWQKEYENLKNDVIFKNGIDDDEIQNNNMEANSMLVLDDLVMEMENNHSITALFTKYMHHKSLFLIYVSQNFYHQSREAHMRHLNSHFIVFFKNPWDKTQLSILARQMFPGRSSHEFSIMFEKVTEKPHGYLLIDLRQEMPAEIHL